MVAVDAERMEQPSFGDRTDRFRVKPHWESAQIVGCCGAYPLITAGELCCLTANFEGRCSNS